MPHVRANWAREKPPGARPAGVFFCVSPWGFPRAQPGTPPRRRTCGANQGGSAPWNFAGGWAPTTGPNKAAFPP